MQWWDCFLSKLDNTFHDLSAPSDTWLLDKLRLIKANGTVATISKPRITEGLSRLHSVAFNRVSEVCSINWYLCSSGLYWLFFYNFH